MRATPAGLLEAAIDAVHLNLKLLVQALDVIVVELGVEDFNQSEGEVTALTTARTLNHRPNPQPVLVLLQHVDAVAFLQGFDWLACCGDAVVYDSDIP